MRSTASSASAASSAPPIREVKVRLPGGGRRSLSQVWNTSLGGVFIAMDPPLPFGSELDMEFVLSRGDNISCEAFVVWSTSTSPDRAPGQHGISVRLASIEISEMRRLAAAVGRNLEE